MGNQQINKSSLCNDDASIIDFNGNNIAWLGRYSIVQKKNNLICKFDWPGVSFVFRITGATKVDMIANCGSSHFSINVRNISTQDNTKIHRIILNTKKSIETINLISDLNVNESYEVIVTKITEPKTRSAFNNFSPVKLHSIHASPIDSAKFLPIEKDYLYQAGWIEVIGDSDACGFGIEGKLSGMEIDDLLSIDPKFENVEHAFGTILAKQILGENGRAVTLAWSGKGIHYNAPFSGPSETIPQLWKCKVASSGIHRNDNFIEKYNGNKSIYSSPHAIIILAGANDFETLFTSINRSDYVQSYINLLKDIREHRAQSIPIYCFQCSVNCAASLGSPSKHPRDDPSEVEKCSKIVEWTREAVETFKCMQTSTKVYFHEIDINLELATDYGSLMHRNVNGNHKIAMNMASVIQFNSVD